MPEESKIIVSFLIWWKLLKANRSQFILEGLYSFNKDAETKESCERAIEAKFECTTFTQETPFFLDENEEAIIYEPAEAEEDTVTSLSVSLLWEGAV